MERYTVPNLLTALPPHLHSILLRATLAAQRQRITLWLVGGVVRDLLLGIPVERDLDLTVEGDAIGLAHLLAQELDGQVVATHAPFGTATVALTPTPATAPLMIDLATTRTEHYPQPAVLPLVQPATIEHDLVRRDFSINAIALLVQVNEADPDECTLHGTTLLDPFYGRDDLAAGVLRVLHDASFRDDPTRILRGVRLSARLGFPFEGYTQSLLTAALEHGYLEATSADRIRTELCLALDEPVPDVVVRVAEAHGILPHIIPPLRWSTALAQRCERASSASRPDKERTLLSTGLLTYDFSTTEREALIQRYHLSREMMRLLRDIDKARDLREMLAQPDLRNSELDCLLRPFMPIALDVVYYSESEPIRSRIAHYATTLRQRGPLLDGYALKQMGVTPGPRLGQLLQELRAAHLDGAVITRADEETWVRQRLANE